MSKSFLFIVSLCFYFGNLSAQQEFVKEGYKLIWADEFNKDGKIDTTKWKYERGFARNQELQWYQEDIVGVRMEC